MNIFDSKSNKKWSGSGISIGDENITFAMGAHAEIPIGCIRYKSILRIVCKKRSGNGLIGVRIISQDKTIIFDSTITLSGGSWSEKIFKILPALTSNEPCILRVYRPNGSFGRVDVARVLINSEIPNDNIDSAKEDDELSDNDRMAYILDHYFNFSTRIAILVPYSIYGGAEVYIKNIISNFNFKFIKIDIICLGDNNISRQLELDNVSCLTERGLGGLRARLLSSDYDTIIYYNSLRVYRMLQDMVESKSLDSKIVEVYHSDFSWSDSISNISDRSGVDKIIRVSDSLLNDISGIEKSCIKTVPVGIEISRFRRREVEDLKASLGISKYKNILGTVSRLSPEKNIQYFINIAGKMQESVFLIIGSGPEEASLKSQCMKSGINNVMFLGHKNNVEIYYSLLDAFILTSNMEGTPISILEAMASGALVFSTPVGAITSIIQDKYSGYFLSKDLNEDVSIIRDNIESKDVIINAKKYVEENHNIVNISRKFLEEIIFEPKFYSRHMSTSGEVILNGVYI